MTPLFGRDELVGQWVGERVGHRIWPPFVGIGMVNRKAELVGGAVFNDYNGANVEVTIAAERGALGRGMIALLYQYAFVQLKVLRVTARTRRGNKRAQRILPRAGFAFEATQKRYFGPTRADDAMVFVATPQSAAKWCSPKAAQ